MSYAGIDFGSIASIDFFTKNHANGAYRSFTAYSLFNLPRYYFPNLAANEETGEIYAWDGDDIWNGATTVESMLALEDYTEWDVSGAEFERLYDPTMVSPNSRFHLFFGQSSVSFSIHVGEEESTRAAAAGQDGDGNSPGLGDQMGVDASETLTGEGVLTSLPERGEEALLGADVSGRRILAIHPAALAGLRPGSADAADHAGGLMDEDSTQLELSLPEEANYLWLTVGMVAVTFLVGFGFEIIRFRRLLGGTARRIGSLRIRSRTPK